MSSYELFNAYVSYTTMCNLHNAIKSLYASKIMGDDVKYIMLKESLSNAIEIYSFVTFVNLLPIHPMKTLNEDQIVDIGAFLGIEEDDSIFGYEDLYACVDYLNLTDHINKLDAYNYMYKYIINGGEYLNISEGAKKYGIPIYLYTIGFKVLAHALSAIGYEDIDGFVGYLARYEAINNIKNKNWTKFDIEQIYAYRNSLRLLQIDTSMKFLDEYDGFTINTIKSIIDIIERSNP